MSATRVALLFIFVSTLTAFTLEIALGFPASVWVMGIHLGLMVGLGFGRWVQGKLQDEMDAGRRERARRSQADFDKMVGL